MNEIKIEKNIPRIKKDNKSKYPFDKMEVGDSFFLESNGIDIIRFRNTLATAANNYRRAENLLNIKFSTQVSDSGVRIWRIK